MEPHAVSYQHRTYNNPNHATVVNYFIVNNGYVVRNYETRKTFVLNGCTPEIGALFNVAATMAVREKVKAGYIE